MNKEFLNKAILIKVLKKNSRQKLVMLHLDEDAVNAQKVDAIGDEAILKIVKFGMRDLVHL